MLKEDVLRTWAYSTGGKARKFITCVRAPGVHAVAALRFGQWAKRQSIPVRVVATPIYLWLNFLIKIAWGIDIPRSAKIGAGFYIGHFGGVIIAPDAVIGDNCNISQGVTIGVSGEGERRGCPTIGNNVYLAPGCKLFGKISIGNNVKIGANAVVHTSIPEGLVVAAPGFIVLRKGPAGNRGFDSASKLPCPTSE
jgi:serine O-acetyltransferase